MEEPSHNIMFDIVQPRHGQMQEGVVCSSTGYILLDQLRYRLAQNLPFCLVFGCPQHQINQVGHTFEDAIEILLLLLKHWTNSQQVARVCN